MFAKLPPASVILITRRTILRMCVRTLSRSLLSLRETKTRLNHESSTEKRAQNPQPTQTNPTRFRTMTSTELVPICDMAARNRWCSDSDRAAQDRPLLHRRLFAYAVCATDHAQTLGYPLGCVVERWCMYHLSSPGPKADHRWPL